MPTYLRVAVVGFSRRVRETADYSAIMRKNAHTIWSSASDPSFTVSFSNSGWWVRFVLPWCSRTRPAAGPDGFGQLRELEARGSG